MAPLSAGQAHGALLLQRAEQVVCLRLPDTAVDVHELREVRSRGRLSTVRGLAQLVVELLLANAQRDAHVPPRVSSSSALAGTVGIACCQTRSSDSSTPRPCR